MSIFLKTKLELSKCDVLSIEWHIKLPLFGILAFTHTNLIDVIILDTKDTKILPVTISKNNSANVIRWHPFDPLLVIGWTSGYITVHNISDNNSVELLHEIDIPVSFIIWSASGKQFLSANKPGCIHIWSQLLNGDYSEKAIISFNIGEDISCCTFLDIKSCFQFNNSEEITNTFDMCQLNSDGITKCKNIQENISNTLKNSEFNIFLIGCVDGNIFYTINILGRVLWTRTKFEFGSINEYGVNIIKKPEMLISCEGNIVDIMHQSEKEILLVITEEGMLYHYFIKYSRTLNAKEITKMKLGLKICTSSFLIWAGSTVIAMCLGESFVRLWDVEKGDNYNLAPVVFKKMPYSNTMKILKLAYSQNNQILAAGIENGIIAFWKYYEIDEIDHILASLQSNLTLAPNNELYGCKFVHRKHFKDYEPENYWHPQACCAIIDEEISTSLVELNQQVKLFSWSENCNCLAIAISSQQSTNDTSTLHDFNLKSSIYLLTKKLTELHFNGNGCAILQTGPKSLVILTTRNSPSPNNKKTTFNLSHIMENIDKQSEFKTNNLNNLEISKSLCTTTLASSEMIKKNEYAINFEEETVEEQEANFEDQIKVLYCTDEHFAYWSGDRICVCSHTTDKGIKHFSSFKCEFPLVGMYKQSIFTTDILKMDVRNLQGIVKQLIHFSEIEGSVVFTARCVNFMACLSNTHKVRVYDVDKREIKCIHSSKSLTKLVLSTALIEISDLNSKHQHRDINQEVLMSASASSDELRINWLSLNKLGNCIGFTIELLASGNVLKSRWSKPNYIEIYQKSTNTWYPDPRIYVYHMDKDRLQFYNFAQLSDISMNSILNSTNVEINDQNGMSNLNSNLLRSSRTSLLKGRWPERHYWDQCDARLLVVQAAPLTNQHPLSLTKSNLSHYSNESVERGIDTPQSQNSLLHFQSDTNNERLPISKLPTTIVSLFINPEQNNMLIHEYFPMAIQHSTIMGVDVPYIYFAVKNDLIYRRVNEQKQNKGKGSILQNPLVDQIRLSDLDDSQSNQNTKIRHINRRIMLDFVGLELADTNTKEAMLNFTYYSALGEMDAAFKAMKFIKNPAVWQNMAKRCVSTCRLDVARVCLGKIGNPMALMMLREARSRESEVEVQAGELALQLGMSDEAERLFIKCNRWDLVIRLYQSLGRWEQALRIAQTHYRIAIRNAHYVYAKELESRGQIQEAINHYISSDTFRFEIPRMLNTMPKLLESFVNQQSDLSIIRWWAQTLEARGCLNEAKSYYNKSKDYLSLVRVLCCLGNEKEAELLCHECGDRAACYHLACHLENKGSVDQAIRLFTRAKAYSSAIRLCKGCNQNDHLFTLSQLGSVDDMLEAAKHLETFADYTDKAVILYNKTGQINRAVELAIETCQFSALQNVITSMDNRLDPILLKKCAQFFIQNNQYDRAVELLAIGQQYSEALTLCGEYNVTITENFAEMLTPQSDKVDHSEKLTILSELGELCTVQGQYYLACKKFTQAGNLIGAMKSLLRSGDTEKIIFFTNVSKHNEIYVMAANYLQTLDDWKSNENIMRTIVQFYTKGHAPESLASFYEACAQAEVDECGNYEKATGALTEAYKCLMKALNSDNIGNALEDRLQRRLVQIKNKATVCKEFMEIESLFSDNAMEAIQRCQILLEGIKPGDILQPGDIYSIMIREFVAQEKFKVAMECLDEMRKRLGDNQIIARYLDRDILEKIHEAIQIPNYETSFHNIDCESKVVHISESPVCEEFEIDTYSSETIDENW